MELSSSRREMLLSLTTNMAAVTSRANQYPGYILLFITASSSLLMKIWKENERKKKQTHPKSPTSSCSRRGIASVNKVNHNLKQKQQMKYEF